AEREEIEAAIAYVDWDVIETLDTVEDLFNYLQTRGVEFTADSRGCYLFRGDLSHVNTEALEGKDNPTLKSLNASVLTRPTSLCLKNVLKASGDTVIYVHGVSINNQFGMAKRYSLYTNFNHTYKKYRQRITHSKDPRKSTSKPQLVVCDFGLTDTPLKWCRAAVSVIPAYEDF
ncbi:hypothetical protein KIPB_016530, partial [Kipferlia bialata]